MIPNCREVSECVSASTTSFSSHITSQPAIAKRRVGADFFKISYAAFVAFSNDIVASVSTDKSIFCPIFAVAQKNGDQKRQAYNDNHTRSQFHDQIYL